MLGNPEIKQKSRSLHLELWDLEGPVERVSQEARDVNAGLGCKQGWSMWKRSPIPWTEENLQHSSLGGLLRAVRFCDLIKRHNTGHTPSLAMALSKRLLNE